MFGRHRGQVVRPRRDRVGEVVDGPALLEAVRKSRRYELKLARSVGARDLSDAVTPNGAAFRSSVAKLVTDVIRDDVNEPGSGLVCFGSFAFADDAFTVETTGREHRVLDHDGPHTNHYLDPDLAALSPPPSRRTCASTPIARAAQADRSETRPARR